MRAGDRAKAVHRTFVQYLGRSLVDNTTLYKVLFRDVLSKMYILSSLFA